MPNKETLRGNENQKCLGMLEMDTIKQTEMKEKCTPYDRETCSKPSSVVEIPSKEKTPGLLP